jgi:hypothetical protein
MTLCADLCLGERNSVTGRGYAISYAANGTARVFFEHDCGLCHFSVGLARENDPWCSVEVIARRFPPVRMLRGGEQRLSLSEQTQLLKDHWAKLRDMFLRAMLADELATEAMVCNMMSGDAAEGMDAFVQKRKPQWKS